jgi:hypothetical protein
VDVLFEKIRDLISSRRPYSLKIVKFFLFLKDELMKPKYQEKIMRLLDDMLPEVIEDHADFGRRSAAIDICGFFGAILQHGLFYVDKLNLSEKTEEIKNRGAYIEHH